MTRYLAGKSCGMGRCGNGMGGCAPCGLAGLGTLDEKTPAQWLKELGGLAVGVAVIALAINLFDKKF